jgi:hypothetical protein
MSNVKFSAIASGGALVAATDTLLAVRSGTTDVLVTPGTAAEKAIGTSGATVPLLNAANTFSAKQTYSAGQYVSGGAIESAVHANGNSGVSFALNMDNGNLQSITISGAVAITQTAPTHPGSYTLIVTQDGSGHTYSLSGILWAGGIAPSFSTAAGKVDIFNLTWSGASWYGFSGIAFS